MPSSKQRENVIFAGGLISAISDGIAIAEKIHIGVIIAISCITFVLISVWLWNKYSLSRLIKVANSLQIDADDIFSHFKTLHAKLIIDISDNVKDVKFIQTRRVECLKHGANKYCYRWNPYEKLTFEHNIGELLISEVNGAADIEVVLDANYDVGDQFDVVLTVTAENLFSGDKDFWLVAKGYPGKEPIHLEVLLPAGLDFLSTDVKIALDHTFKKFKALKKKRKIEPRNGRIALVVDTKNGELKIGQQLSVNWKYKR